MSCNLDRELLESLVLGELGDDRADEVEAHVAECHECAGELDWLRLELRAFETRASTDASDQAERDMLWDRIEAQIDGVGEPEGIDLPEKPGRRRPVLYFLSGFGAASLAAAAAVLLWVQLDKDTDNQAPVTNDTVAVAPTKTIGPAKPATSDQKLAAARAALDKAEDEYENAIAALEATYKARRHRLAASKATGYDKAMASSSTALRQARKAAGDDIDARMRVLDMYSSHVHTLQSLVADSDL